MGFFGTKQEKTLAEKLAGFKSAFTEAHDGAVSLQADIEEELQANFLAVANAKTAQAETEKLKKENEAFINNLKKLI